MTASSPAINFHQLAFEAGKIFTPGSPLNERELFAGRSDQVAQIIGAISQKGYHAVLYGDRGVGKTSLSNVLIEFLEDVGQHTMVMPRVNCDASDDFSSLWRKVLRDVSLSKTQQGVGFTAKPIELNEDVLDLLPEQVAPDDVRRAISHLSDQFSMVIIFDEFDRLKNPITTVMMADTIKSLSDHAVDATIMLIGVADSVDALVGEHQSIERALVQVKLPRMSQAEVEQIITKGTAKLGLTIKHDALKEISALSQGLPYVTHLISLHACRAALNRQSLDLTLTDVQTGVRNSLSQWQQSVITTYHTATHSHQPEHLFREVLAACALAVPDATGYFTAASVRHPLRVITGKTYDIPNFARHLNEFTKTERGAILQRTGETRKIRYRFSSPLIKPYIIMRSVADGLLTRKKMEVIEREG
ncbi:AAA family ATPase [Bradyrhizobium sp. DASA03076]|uniref:nSTAND1 domain-containing NTPase n=1 Tax=Bradyrhizobium sp. BLXBL-03 TaxID=3395916 RepID=UPI003F72F63F